MELRGKIVRGLEDYNIIGSVRGNELNKIREALEADRKSGRYLDWRIYRLRDLYKNDIWRNRVVNLEEFFRIYVKRNPDYIGSRELDETNLAGDKDREVAIEFRQFASKMLK